MRLLQGPKLCLTIMVILWVGLCSDLYAKQDVKDAYLHLHRDNDLHLEAIKFFISLDKHAEGIFSLGLRRDFIPTVFDLDRMFIQMSIDKDLSYDRTWLINWLPKKESSLSLKDFCNIYYYNTTLPIPWQTLVIDMKYNVGGNMPNYVARRLDTDMRLYFLNHSGYYIDNAGSIYYDPNRALEQLIIRIPHLQKSLLEIPDLMPEFRFNP